MFIYECVRERNEATVKKRKDKRTGLEFETNGIGRNIEEIITMKSLILAQDER